MSQSSICPGIRIKVMLIHCDHWPKTTKCIEWQAAKRDLGMKKVGYVSHEKKDFQDAYFGKGVNQSGRGLVVFWSGAYELL